MPNVWTLAGAPSSGECFVTFTNVGRGDIGGKRFFEPKMEPKLALAKRNSSRAGTSRKDLQILARGCHGTWLPQVTGPRQASILKGL